MKLDERSLQDRGAWERIGVRLPAFDRKAMREETAARPTWVHFGPGNLFRAFHAMIQQTLIEQGLARGGIYAVATGGRETIEASYAPYDDLSILVTRRPDGESVRTVVAAVTGCLCADAAYPADYERLIAIFRAPSLQLATFTITEKGYALTGGDGRFFPMAERDIAAGPHKGKHAMSKLASMLLERFRAGGAPLAAVSTDNCSRNGEKLRSGVMTLAEAWRENGFVEKAFVDWVGDERNVSFPWTMIDKITPRPAQSVADELARLGIEGMDVHTTPRGGRTAAFVNAEEPQYLVIEDRFPNGRPPLEAAGVSMTDRETVERVEKMKVSACLNPLHTALAVFGCLLGYDSIAAEMRDAELKRLVERIGYDEGLPVVADPGIIRPADFLHEVIERRFPDPFVPDTPQRIAADTSQKIPVRYGETIKSYVARGDLDPGELVYIPLAIAGWLRYLLGLDDGGRPFVCSGDPRLEELQERLSGVELGRPDSLGSRLRPILADKALFGADLTALALGGRIERMVKDMLRGPGAVRATLKRYLDDRGEAFRPGKSGGV